MKIPIKFLMRTLIFFFILFPNFQAFGLEFPKDMTPSAFLNSLEEKRENGEPVIRHSQLKSYQNILKCKSGSRGRIKQTIYDLDLSPQFPMTYSQGARGNCWSYSGTSAVEAAAKRATGQIQSFSPLYVSACTVMDDSKELASNVDKLVAEGLDGDSERLPTLVDGFYPKEAIDDMLDRDNVCRNVGEFERIFQSIQQEQCGAINLFNTEVVSGKSENVAIALGGASSQVACKVSLNKTIKADFRKRIGEYSNSDKVEDFNFRGYSRQPIKSHRFKKEVYKTIGSDGEMSHEKCKLNNKDNRKVIDSIVQQLCHGRPVATTLAMNKVNYSNNGGESWRQYNGSEHSFHAMVITGIKYDTQGRPHFIMRNSWKEGDAKHKNKSLASIPVEQACRIYDNQVVLAPKERLQRPVKDLDKNRLLQSFK